MVGWKNFLNVLHDTGSLHKLIINKVYWSYFDDLGAKYDTIANIDIANDWLENLYYYISKTLSSKQFINYPPEVLVGNSKHKWGRAPFHFQLEYESCFIDSLKKYGSAIQCLK